MYVPRVLYEDLEMTVQWADSMFSRTVMFLVEFVYIWTTWKILQKDVSYALSPSDTTLLLNMCHLMACETVLESHVNCSCKCQKLQSLLFAGQVQAAVVGRLKCINGLDAAHRLQLVHPHSIYNITITTRYLHSNTHSSVVHWDCLEIVIEVVSPALIRL